jgi:hypothetical protein
MKTRILLSSLLVILLSCEDQHITELDPRLYNDAFHGSIIGKVLQKESNARVSVSQVDTVATTNINSVDGSFLIENLPIGNYDLSIVAQNYRIYTQYNVKVEGAGTTYLGQIDLSTVPDLVASHYPEDQGEIVYNNQFQRLTVSVLFTQPMDRKSVEEAFSTEPPSEGIFYWGLYSEEPNYIYFAGREDWGFVPEATITTYSKITSFSYKMAQKDSYTDTTYNVILSQAAHDTAGNHLRFPLEFSFSTVQSAATIYGIQTYPSHGDIDVDLLSYDGIQITFPRNMDAASTEAAISITPDMQEVFIWPDWNDLTIYTGGIFLADTKYEIKIDSTAQDLDGIPLGEPFMFSFNTAAVSLTSTTPRNGELFVDYIDQYIIMRFNTYMIKSTVENAFSISPHVTGNFIWGTRYGSSSKTVISFIPAQTLKPNTKYTVTIDSTAQDLYGSKLKEPYTFAFITRPE